jgi:hypothetical protein
MVLTPAVLRLDRKIRQIERFVRENPHLVGRYFASVASMSSKETTVSRPNPYNRRQDAILNLIKRQL